MEEVAKVETRAVRVAKRRAEVLKDFNDKFADFCIEEAKTKNTPHEQLRSAVYKLDLYIQSLIKAKPQEQSFYVSVALEFQRQKVKLLQDIQDAKKKTNDSTDKKIG